MFGPVVQRELRSASRRTWLYYFRGVYAGWLVEIFALFFALYLARCWVGSDSPARGVVVVLFWVLLAQQLLLPMLLLPAFAAAALTEEKARGTLADLLTTELTSGEIIGGKALTELLRVAYLFLAGWPMVGFAGALAGLEPGTLLALLACGLAPLPALAAAGLLASVWFRTTASAALAAYALAAAGFAALWASGAGGDVLGLLANNPDPGHLVRAVAWTWAAWGGLALAYLAVAVWRFRPACRRQLTAAAPRRQAAWVWDGRPAVGDSPLRWKGQYVDGLVGVPALRRVPPWLGVWGVGAAASL